jgi:hypothetical protein
MNESSERGFGFLSRKRGRASVFVDRNLNLPIYTEGMNFLPVKCQYAVGLRVEFAHSNIVTIFLAFSLRHNPSLHQFTNPPIIPDFVLDRIASTPKSKHLCIASSRNHRTGPFP